MLPNRPSVLWLVVAVAAGCGGSGPADDPAPDAGPDEAFCASRACRSSVASTTDWQAVSVPSGSARCDLVEVSKFLVPVDAAAAAATVPGPVFIDVRRRALHLDFLRQDVAEVFAGLTEPGYQALVQRRASRQLWAGALHRITDIDGATTAYGFDVIVDPTDYEEALTEAEVTSIHAALAAQFTLPLVYAPTTDDAIGQTYQFETLPVWLPRNCSVVPCTDATAACAVVPTALTTCGVFMEGRPIDEEYAFQVQLTVPAGEVVLPIDVGTHAVEPVFGAGVFGPSQAALAPTVGPASFEVAQIGDYRYGAYRQGFTADGETYWLAWDVPMGAVGTGVALAEPWLANSFYAILESTGPDARGVARLSSCEASLHQRWQLAVSFADGSGATIDTRYVPPSAGSGPVLPTRAEVTLDGTTAVVDDYFGLVYAGLHHNWDNAYWVLFDAPITYQGHLVYGLELAAMANLDTAGTAATLDADQQPLDVLTITDFAFARP